MRLSLRMNCLAKLLSIAVASSALSACAPASLVMNRDGPIVDQEAAQDTQSWRFKEIWEQAKKTESAAHPANDRNDGSVTAEEAAANRRLLDAGMSLVYNGCNDFFISEGRIQQRLSFSKDLTGAIIPNLSGALGLIPAAGIASPLVGFIGGGATTGMNAAAANFLFGSDAIDDVRTMALNALATHENSVKEIFAQSVMAGNKAKNLSASDSASLVVVNFFWVTKQIADHQAICQPGKILLLARQAIAQANVCASTSASSTDGQGDKATPSAGTASPKQTGGSGASPPSAEKKDSAPHSPVPERVIVKVQPSCDTKTPKPG